MAAEAGAGEASEQLSDSSRVWEAEDRRREEEEANMQFIQEDIERCRTHHLPLNAHKETAI